ncbi:hypothetical protein TcWFU_009346 [Taenia crassiceps]|uniref:Uncharacterized protein n=1 Tax=Taenia crassiceps TaxID=6207 RepID=A0ABR4QF40_9CEST
MSRGCGKFAILSGLCVGSAVGTVNFIYKVAAIMAGVFVGSLAKYWTCLIICAGDAVRRVGACGSDRRPGTGCSELPQIVRFSAISGDAVESCSAWFATTCLPVASADLWGSFVDCEVSDSSVMSSYRHEERTKSHTAGSRMRGDVRFASKDEDSRRFDGPRRLRDKYTNHPYEMENERIVHRNRYNDGLIVRVPNDLCHNPNAPLTSRWGQDINHPQASLRSSFKSANNGHPTDAPSQPRIRFETSGRQRSLSYREELTNIPEPSMLPLDWKPDASGISMDYRVQAKIRQRGKAGRRGMSSTPRTSCDWDRSSGGRRGGGGRGVSNRGGRMRRRGGGDGDDATASFRVSDYESAYDQDNQVGDRPRGGLRHRNKMRSFRSARRGGTRRGAIDVHCGSKNEVEDYACDVGEHRNSENLEDSNSTDDDQYRLTVDLKVDNVKHADATPGQANDREEHIDGGLNILVESHEGVVDSSEESLEEEEEVEDSEEASKASDGGSASDADGDTSEVSNGEIETEEDGSSQTGRASEEPGPLGKEPVQKSSEEVKTSDDIIELQQQGPSVEKSKQRDEGPPHEHEVPQISEERLSHKSLEESKTPENKTPSTEISPETNEARLKEDDKMHCLAPSSHIEPEELGGNTQLIQDSGDCETSFESVPADEIHNLSNSIINDESITRAKRVTPERPETSVGNVEKAAKEAPLEGSIRKDSDTKTEEPPTEEILTGKISSSS